jgi:DNA helicase-2/ATP-dependent DNA helicase PcrA
MDSVLDGLNEQQACAVTSRAPVLQVLAPPGSGKTKTLTARVAYLISHFGLRPWNMIVCTFTIKAAREMKERIHGFIGEERQGQLVLGTFHSVCRQYLIRYGHYVGVAKGFGIADSGDSLSIIKRLVKRYDFQFEPGKARARISRRKSRMEFSPASKGPPSAEAQEFEELYNRYQGALTSSNLLDYDDLLLKCVELLTKRPDCVSNVEAVLIDEFQDTNTVQYRLMSLFAQGSSRNQFFEKPSITIVGDPDQSIYAFRSAEIKNLIKMQEQYRETQVVILEDNYRSSTSIINFASEIIEQDESRPDKRMQSTHLFGPMPTLKLLPTANDEATWIVSEVKRVMGMTAGLLSLSDIAILLRSSSQSQKIESQLGQSGIPYRMVGNHKFFERIEVRIVLDYLRVIGQPQHTDALLRVLNNPPRGVGDKAHEVLVEYAETNNTSLWAVVHAVATGKCPSILKDRLSSQAKKGLDAFVGVILSAQKKLESLKDGSHTVETLMDFVLQKLSLREFLQGKHDKEDFENRWDNIMELRTQAATVLINPGEDAEDDDNLVTLEGLEESEELSGPRASLVKYLANIALTTDPKKGVEETHDMITISTIHSAKGLEWAVVFVPGAYDGSIPHSRSDDVDEERRLLYVAATRPKCLLALSWAPDIAQGGQVTLSRFLLPLLNSRFLCGRGPSLDQQIVGDMAAILRRDCPTDESFAAAYLKVEEREDKLFLDDKDSIEKAGTNQSQGESYAFPPAKRQRFGPGQYQREGFSSGPYLNKPDHMSQYASRTGFVSASVLKRDLAPAKEHFSETQRLREIKNASTVRTKAQKKGPKKAAGQASLMSFGFAKPKAGPVEDIPLQPVEEQRPAFAGAKRSRPMPESNTESSFAVRRIRTAPTFQVPRVQREDEDEPRYTTLLSSPSRPSSRDAVAHTFGGGGSTHTATSSSSISVSTSRSSIYHTTTISQSTSIQQKPNRVYRFGMSRRVAQPGRQ